ncbi:hypothetical protein GWS13_20875 [Salmonella enterica]|nr:hypothetical protein [Salmonella enterica]EHR4097510.1 hypothetical protein [Salmonella enterica subsp. enterica serovar Montevideo]EBK9093898.1 hypothetical protein [Salmonella enterica]EEF7919370.1 hypothetical protein [Salmonella enterica]EEG1961537.1 hypothetical protein [Salmonella enterica]
MQKFYVVWNSSKREGVIFLRDEEDEALGDALHAGGGPDISGYGVSSLADSFREIYGECSDAHLQSIQLDTTQTTLIEKD